MTGICEGLNVVEMGGGSIAAALAGMVLADAGARVVKIEPPQGDRLRESEPSGFKVWNRGKESLVADLRAPDGQETLRALAAGADVVVEAFSPGVAAGWGIDAEALRAANPSLVHCAITGFGATGPYAHLKGYDAVVAAKLGLWARGAFAFRDGPLMYPAPWGSYGCAMQAVAGIMGALIARETTGRGQALNATLASGFDPIDYMIFTSVQLGAKRGAPAGDRSAMPISRYGVLAATRDGRLIQTATVLPHQGKALCEVAGVGHLLSDPRFARLPAFDTAEDAQAWEDLVLEAFLKEDLAHWLPKLQANKDVSFEVAGTSEEGTRHPQIIHNGDVVTIEDPDAGPMTQVGPIGHFSRTPMTPQRPAPRVGVNAGVAFEALRPNASDAPAPAHPFAGVTIVEFGYFYAMPYGVAMLAALGARVIKIEDAKGDPHRVTFGPEVGTNKTTAGKESLSVDLSRPEGRAIAQKLAAKADVFITGFRTGVPEKLGLGFDELRRLNPRLLYVHAAGYGRDGPYAKRALYAQAAQAVAGSFGRQVGYWCDPQRVAGWSLAELQALVFPRLHQVIDGDSNAALAVLAATALGLYEQRRSGRGQRLDTSMIAGNAWAYADDFCTYEGKPARALCDEDHYGVHALERLYPAADGTWLCIALRTQREFEALASAIDADALAVDPRFATAEARRENDAALIEALSDTFLRRPALEWEGLLSAADVGAAAVSMQGLGAFTSFDAGLREAGLTTTVRHPLFGEMVRWAPPVTFSEQSGRVAPACLRGQHNRALLAELGYAQAEVDRLETAGVICPPDTHSGPSASSKVS